MKSIQLLLFATSCVLSPLAWAAQTPALLRTFNNPAPEAGDHFGIGVAALGSDRVLIGAPNYIGNPTPPTNVASVHLFHTNGTMLTTIAKPAAVGEEFGTMITTLGSDRIVIGSLGSFHVCLFTTNGALVTIITNLFQPLRPIVVAIGNDKLLIGSPLAYWNRDTELSEGAAFLYSTNGTLLKAFFNPNPETVNGFGWSAFAFGSDRVLIGANQDSSGSRGAFLFHTNGTLLMPFPNPAPSIYDYFGRSVAAVGTDRIFVGSPTGGAGAEEVYMFNTNGTLLVTITNPTPAADDWFGHRITMLGSDRVVISAHGDDATGPGSGSAYVFNLNGTLLATIKNPAPGLGDYFGYRLATFGNDGVIIGAPWHNGGGSAYLLRVPATPVAPSLTIQLTVSNTVAVSWPSASVGYELQQNTDLTTTNWTTPPETVTDSGTTKSISLSPAPGPRFFRLLKP